MGKNQNNYMHIKNTHTHTHICITESIFVHLRHCTSIILQLKKKKSAASRTVPPKAGGSSTAKLFCAHTRSGCCDQRRILFSRVKGTQSPPQLHAHGPCQSPPFIPRHTEGTGYSLPAHAKVPPSRLPGGAEHPGHGGRGVVLAAVLEAGSSRGRGFDVLSFLTSK